jgi:hypothetical protein
MGAYQAIKKMGIGLMHWMEYGFGGWAARRAMNKKLHKDFLAGAPDLDPAYKQEIEDFWRPYTLKFDRGWHRYFAKSGQRDPRILPEDIYQTHIDRYLNDRDTARGLKDKNYFPLLFPDIDQPRTLIHIISGQWLDQEYRLISRQAALDLAGREEQLSIKPSLDSGGGKNIRFWKAKDGRDKLEAMVDGLGDNLTVQEVIKQHKVLNDLHKDSVNTIRLVTLIWKGQVHAVSSMLRMGVEGNRMDNGEVGGISAGILADGRLKDRAVRVDGKVFKSHPGGARFEDCIIPNYPALVETFKVAHMRMAHSKLVSWDIAVGRDGQPILVEANLYCGGLKALQLNNGPLFGDLTDQVLEAVFIKGKKA